MIKSLSVLNTVTANGTDLSFSEGLAFIKGCAPIPALDIIGIKKQSPVTGVAGVITVTPTAANNTLYELTITFQSSLDGTLRTFPLSYTTASSGDTATTICNAFRTQLGDAANINFVASGTATLILTTTTTQPFIIVGGSLASQGVTATSGAVTVAPNITAQCGTAGVFPQGTVAALQTKYPPNSLNNATNFEAISTLTSGSTYIEYVISYNESPATGGLIATPAVDTNQAVVLVKSDATNVDDLCGTYGTLTGLTAGYKYTITAPATTTAAVTVTTGAIALAGGAATFASLAAKSGDIIVINTGTSFSTYDTTTITGITGLTAGFGTKVTATSAGVFKHVSISNIGF